ncbi:MAG: hypothetical protein HGB31_09845, partial [Erysipelotrichaceae bacterium]|nr:hypothetical protein [Erysipelotrichaceae bacterium]
MKKKSFRLKSICLMSTMMCMVLSACTAAAEDPTETTEFTDVVYAQKSSSEKCDIYLPSDGTGTYPVIIAVHG